MIELMLEAERAMGIGLFDNAERLYRQVVAADPRNSIAWTGLARVALEREDQRGAYQYARRAIALDPDNPVASHLARRMAEQLQIRGEDLPADLDAIPPTPSPTASPTASADSPGSEPTEATSRGGLVDRLLRRRR
jgi:uncharacterized protein HemY